jgi:ubiquinone biosynthesis protein
MPTIYPQYSTSKVLTMEFIKGVKISDVESIDAAGLDCSALAHDLVQAITKQVLFDGFFHADPHPGNVIVNLESGDIAFLDMGLMGELDRIPRMALADMLVSIREKDGYSLGKATLRLCDPLPGKTIDETAFLENMVRFGQRFLEVQGGDFSHTFSSLQGILERSGLRLKGELTLAFKSWIQVESVVRNLDPSIDISAAAVESAIVIGRDAFTGEALANTVNTQISRSVREVVYRLPNLVDATTKWLDQYERGRLSMHIDTSDLSKEVTKLDRAFTKSLDRLIIGLVLAGWLIGAAIASTIDVNLMGIQLSDLAFYMFILGAVISGYVVLQAIFRLNREEDEG